ncbi:hypothetical protein BOTBODRAFT_58932 [Botryobasidium botryosum FD-172 SS1]|uniref:Uncharacterized protein n=1 Tax=Botryobasidium botryosum (strain FD-172 SS1) TaxID=930990 RepID=A0A067MBP6_BOTB1|nr:hypothetical protein BOTBODRAFT_58932 [Botryobasidium botryosum FD-172 SS1]
MGPKFDIREATVRWGASMQFLIDTLKQPPDWDKDAKGDILKWCRKVKNENDNASAICDRMLKQGYQAPVNTDVQEQVKDVVARLAKLDKRSTKKIALSRGSHMLEQSAQLAREVAGTSAPSDEARGARASGSRETQDVEEAGRLITREGMEVLEHRGLTIAVVRDGVAHYHLPCKNCGSKSTAVCEGHPFGPCRGCAENRLPCEYAIRGEQPSHTPQLAEITPAAGGTGKIAKDGAGVKLNAQTIRAHGANRELADEWLRLESILRIGYSTYNEKRSTEKQEVLRRIHAPEPPAEPPKKTASKFSKKKRNTKTKGARGAQPKGGVTKRTRKKKTAVEDKQPRPPPTKATATEVKEKADFSELKALREELNVAKTALIREQETVFAQQDHSNRLQKQVDDLTLELGSLRRAIQRVGDSRREEPRPGSFY